MVEARIVAHFVDTAEKAGFTPEEINRRLRQLADTTVLDEFWITDEKGHAYLRNIDVEFTLQSVGAVTASGLCVLAAAQRQEGSGDSGGTPARDRRSAFQVCRR